LLAKGGFEYGHRTLYEAARFCAIYAAAGDIKISDALDLQILQKILPRLHGSRRRLEPTLCALGRYAATTEMNLDADYGDGSNRFNPEATTKDEAKLPRSFEKIRRMIRSLRANQFVSFTE
jgi:5-methylcytosine-specific restriction protein B